MSRVASYAVMLLRAAAGDGAHHDPTTCKQVDPPGQVQASSTVHAQLCAVARAHDPGTMLMPTSSPAVTA
jgi:hypothetical protein